MLIQKGGPFNMWDTNGRRYDILNALGIYLRILDDLDKEFPNEPWAKYPSSVKQYEFYKRAIEASPEIFKEHSSFDTLSVAIEANRTAFNQKDEVFIKSIGLSPYKPSINPIYKNFDLNIEKRARHYTSNLVKIGFADENRIITQAGRDYMSGKIKRDDIEKILPLDDINIIVLRQLLKLRIFQKEDDGQYSFYNPVLYCMNLLLSDKNYTENEIKAYVLLQGGSSSISAIPDCFLSNEVIDKDDFKKHIKNRKSDTIHEIYYKFYLTLREFVNSPCQLTYDNFIKTYQDNIDELKGAFLLEVPLTIKSGQKWLSLTDFQSKNANSPWLLAGEEFNEFFYKQHLLSKLNRLKKEYGDTLFRLLKVTGIFRFDKALPELSYKDVFKRICSQLDMSNLIFGTVSEDEYVSYEQSFGNTSSTINALSLSKLTVNEIVDELKLKYGTNIQKALLSEKAEKLVKHIKAKYPKDKVVELLGYFSDRKNDKKIREYVTTSADVPTIYEYIVAVAWYYISDMDFSLFDSMNLTLDANYEPAHHAGGGAGDIVVYYPDKVIMLEATLMNKSAQKRGEWEPVLRHSINLKSDNEDKQVTTLFVADELDTNTINIWRAVASVPLEASNGGAQTDHVYIMPLTNNDMSGFIKDGVKSTNIINAVRKSYDGINYSFDENWRDDILQSLSA